MSKILVVDDEQAIVDVLAYNLTKAGHQPIIARDGEQALQLARAERPDLVILDLMLPGIDGLDVCRKIRKDGDLPIIMLTAKDEEMDRVVGLELGADDYVVKPFSVRELMARVKSVLRRAQPKLRVHADSTSRRLEIGYCPARSLVALHAVRVDGDPVRVAARADGQPRPGIFARRIAQPGVGL